MKVCSTAINVKYRDYSSWRLEIAKFAEGEELFKLDDGLQRVQGEAVIPFNNFIEDGWEQLAMFTLNPGNRDRLLEKYQHMYFIDHDLEGHEVEIRRIVSIEWITGRRAARGIPGVESQYFARCLLVCQDHEEYQGEEDFV